MWNKNQKTGAYWPYLILKPDRTKSCEVWFLSSDRVTSAFQRCASLNIFKVFSKNSHFLFQKNALKSQIKIGCQLILKLCLSLLIWDTHMTKPCTYTFKISIKMNEQNENILLFEICEKSFKKKVLLNFHIKNIHIHGTNEYKCNICTRSFNVKNLLQKHIKNIHKSHRFKMRLL